MAPQSLLLAALAAAVRPHSRIIPRSKCPYKLARSVLSGLVSHCCSAAHIPPYALRVCPSQWAAPGAMPLAWSDPCAMAQALCSWWVPRACVCASPLPLLYCVFSRVQPFDEGGLRLKCKAEVVFVYGGEPRATFWMECLNASGERVTSWESRDLQLER